MRVFIVLMFMTLSLFAEYTSGKIDMHGGDYESSYQPSKSHFSHQSMGVSFLIDKNSSKPNKPLK
jgi:hypothetical protein